MSKTTDTNEEVQTNKNKLKKPIIIKIFLALAVVLVIAGAFFVWKWWENKDVVAVVGKTKITKEQVARQTEIDKKIADATKNSSFAEIDAVKNRMIEVALIQLIAQENDIKVTSEEINNLIKKDADVSYDGKTDSLFKEYKDYYGYTKAELENIYLSMLLQKRVSQKFTPTISGRYLETKFDEATDSESDAKKLIYSYKERLVHGENFDKIFQEASTLDSAVAGTGSFFDEYFASGTKAAKFISKTSTTKSNNYSPIMKGDNDYSITYITETKQGKFNNYQEMIDSYKSNNVKTTFISKFLTRVPFINKIYASSGCTECGDPGPGPGPGPGPITPPPVCDKSGYECSYIVSNGIRVDKRCIRRTNLCSPGASKASCDRNCKCREGVSCNAWTGTCQNECDGRLTSEECTSMCKITKPSYGCFVSEIAPGEPGQPGHWSPAWSCSDRYHPRYLCSWVDPVPAVAPTMDYKCQESAHYGTFAADPTCQNSCVFSPNPILSRSCALNISLVIDNSTSIDAVELEKMKNAMISFVDAFTFKGSTARFSVIKYGDYASRGSFSNNFASIKNQIRDIHIPTSAEGTNWQDALLQSRLSFLSGGTNSESPNLIIFASDGNPTMPSGNGMVNERDLNSSILVANGIKKGQSTTEILGGRIADPTSPIVGGVFSARIIAFGISDDNFWAKEDNTLNIGNLVALTGQKIDQEKITDSDVITANFNSLGTKMKELAIEMCGASCTLTANPTSVTAGNKSNLSWSTHFELASNKNSFTLNKVNKPLSGQESTGEINATTTYTGEAKSADGKIGTCSATVAISTCPTVIDGICGTAANTCIEGTPNGWNGATWTCKGSPVTVPTGCNVAKDATCPHCPTTPTVDMVQPPAGTTPTFTQTSEDGVKVILTGHTSLGCGAVRTQSINYKKDSDAGWNVYKEIDIPETDTANFSFTPAPLLKDDNPIIDPATGKSFGTRYEWQVVVYPKGEPAPAAWKGGYFFVKKTPPTLSCQISPSSGSSPLTIKMSPVGRVSGPYHYILKSPSNVTLIDKTTSDTTIIYTLSEPGKYIGSISNTAAPIYSGNCEGTVSSAGSGSGGEVAP